MERGHPTFVKSLIEVLKETVCGGKKGIPPPTQRLHFRDSQAKISEGEHAVFAFLGKDFLWEPGPEAGARGGGWPRGEKSFVLDVS